MCRSPSTSDDRHVHYLPRNLKLPVTGEVRRGSIPRAAFENPPDRAQFIFGYAPCSGSAADVTGRRPGRQFNFRRATDESNARAISRGTVSGGHLPCDVLNAGVAIE